ncbi:MAG: transposase, partial [Proteobacteria bacterium]|nr:transposase [Pseudomonadota bacterium]
IAQEANAAEKSLRTLMVRESSLVSTEEQARLEGLLAQYPTLKTVYEMRLSLQQVWARRGESKEAMLDALRDWVARAEASGIAALREFADEFKSYALPRAAA